MLAIERAQYILDALENNKVVMVTDLSRDMGVSEETVRRDLEKLEKQERLCRVHGGAYLNEGFGNETPVTVRSQILRQEKEQLAARCMDLVQEKDSLFLDCSTTAWHVASHLGAMDKKLTVVTNSLRIAEAVAENQKIRLILLGGEFNRDTQSFDGQMVLDGLEQCYIGKAFISSNGISLKAGITDATRAEAEVRRRVLELSGKNILVMDQTKIGRTAVYKTGSIEQISGFVTDGSEEEIDRSLREELHRLDVQILSAGTTALGRDWK